MNKLLVLVLVSMSSSLYAGEDLIFYNDFEKVIVCPEANSDIVYDLSIDSPEWFKSYKDNLYWSVETDPVEGLVISKPQEDGTIPASLFTTAGLVSGCSLIGDFYAELTYDWIDITIPTFTGETGVELFLVFQDTGEFARVLNYSSHDLTHRSNACDSNTSTCPGTVFGAFAGKLVIERIGSDLTFYATDDNDQLVELATFQGSLYEGPVKISIRGRQGSNVFEPRDSMSVGISSMRIAGDDFQQ